MRDSAEALSPLLESAGFNAWGVLSPGRYDSLVPSAWRTRRQLPSARAVVLLATGGPAFFRAMLAWRSAGRVDEPEPVDVFAAEVVRDLCIDWRRRGWPTEAFHYYERPGSAGEEGEYADFVALGQACGLGTPSRLGLLLNPRFGPWFAIRSMLLTERPLERTLALAGPGPCHDCPAPCASVCPVSAPKALGFDRVACRSNREAQSQCRTRCDARRACVIGPEHAYDEQGEAHHMIASLDVDPGGH